MTKNLEESHQKCFELENQLATYKLNEEKNSNKIQKLSEEKEQAIKFAIKLQKKLGECEFELEENKDEKCCELEKKLAAYELNDKQSLNVILLSESLFNDHKRSKIKKKIFLNKKSTKSFLVDFFRKMRQSTVVYFNK